MDDEKRPQQPAGADKPADGPPETPAPPESKPPEPPVQGAESAPPAPPGGGGAEPPADGPEGGASKPPDTGAKPEGAEGKPPAAKPAGDVAKPEGAAKPPAAAAKPPAAAKKPVARKPPPKKPTVMETTPWDDDLAKDLKGHFGDQIPELLSYRGQDFAVVKPEAVIPVLEYLKLEADFDYLVDVTAADYPKKEPRFEVIYIVYSFARNTRIRIKTRVADGEKVESAVGVHVTANWLEREVYDMFGIEFANHPDLKRILLPEDWEGFPLRKEKSITEMDERWVKENVGIDSAQ